MPFGERASLNRAFVAAAVLRSKDCAESIQDTQDRKGDAARFGPRAARLSPGMAFERMRMAVSTSVSSMGVTEEVGMNWIRDRAEIGPKNSNRHEIGQSVSNSINRGRRSNSSADFFVLEKFL